MGVAYKDMVFVYHEPEPEKKGKSMKRLFTSVLGLLLAITLMMSAPAAGVAA